MIKHGSFQLYRAHPVEVHTSSKWLFNNVFVELRKNKKVFIRNFDSAFKTQDFSTSISETIENVYLFVFIP